MHLIRLFALLVSVVHRRKTLDMLYQLGIKQLSKYCHGKYPLNLLNPQTSVKSCAFVILNSLPVLIGLWV